MKSIWAFLNSLKLTVYLVLAITAVTIYGSMVIYIHPEVFGSLEQSLFLIWLFGEGLLHPELTWWLYLLVAMIVLLGLNTAVCTTERLPNIVKQLPEKKRWLPFVPHVVHAGVLLFMIAHLISGLYGYRNSGFYLFEGESAKSPGGDYYLRLEKVKVDYRPDGSLKNFGSLLTVLKDGSAVKTGWVRANHPLFVEGGAVYQREFGQAPVGLNFAAQVKSSGFSDKVSLSKETPSASIPGGYRLSVEKFMPDFELDETGQPLNRSDEMNNPAALVTLYRDGRPKSGGWLLMREGMTAPGGFTDDDVSLRFTGPEMRAYSSFDINRDPGAYLALAASALVMFGTVITLYFRRERG